jgi:hypothetical protein
MAVAYAGYAARFASREQKKLSSHISHNMVKRIFTHGEEETPQNQKGV